MKTLTLLSGTVSHASIVSSTSGSVSTSDDGHVRGNISTFHTTMFRVDGKPVRFEQAMNLANGDGVTLVGYDKTEFEPLVLRNDSTGVMYRKGGMGPFFGAAVVGFLSGIMMPYVVGGFSLSNIPDHLDWPALGLMAMGALALAGGLHMIRREQSAVSMLPPSVVSRRR